MTRGLNIDTNSASSKKPIPVDTSEFTNYEEFPGSLRLSKHIYLRDVVMQKYPLIDQKGLSRAQIVGNLKNLAVNVLDPIKDKYPDMIISSGFRHGTSNSDHYVGQAVDLQFNRHSQSEHYEIIKWIRTNVPFKQLLLEYLTDKGGLVVWIHVAFSKDGAKSGLPIATFYNHAPNNPGARNAFVQLEEIKKTLV